MVPALEAPLVRQLGAAPGELGIPASLALGQLGGWGPVEPVRTTSSSTRQMTATKATAAAVRPIRPLADAVGPVRRGHPTDGGGAGRGVRVRGARVRGATGCGLTGPAQYARAGIAFFWRVEQAATGIPIVHTFVLDPATGTYRADKVHTGLIAVAAPFPLKTDLTRI